MSFRVDLVAICQSHIGQCVSLQHSGLSSNNQNFVACSQTANWINCRCKICIAAIFISSMFRLSRMHSACRGIIDMVKSLIFCAILLTGAIFCRRWLVQSQSCPRLSCSKMPYIKGFTWCHNDMAGCDTQIQRFNVYLQKNVLVIFFIHEMEKMESFTCFVSIGVPKALHSKRM